jgi:hypothetical protein
MRSVDLAACTFECLRTLSAEVNRGVALLEGYATRIAAEARQREASGSAPIAEEITRGHGDISHGRAANRTARAALGELLPKAGAAAAAGTARPENLDALAAAVGRMSDTERDRLAAEDGELTRRAGANSPEEFTRHLRRRARALKDPPAGDQPSEAERQKESSWFSMRPKGSGLWDLAGELDPERATVVHDRLQARARHLAGDETITSNHWAQALYDLTTGTTGDGPAPRMGIGYIVDAATLFHPRSATSPGGARGQATSTSTANDGRGTVVAETWHGEPVEAAAVRRLACDADLYAIVVDRLGRSGPVGRTHRAATRDQRLALRALYPSCPLDGATPFSRCEIHHVNLAFEAGGDTELPNLVPVSDEWHHRIHDRGWTLTMDADRTLHLHRPDGTHHRTIPPPTPITRQRE